MNISRLVCQITIVTGLLFAPLPGWAQGAGKGAPTALSPEKSRSRETTTPLLQPRAPVAGQPFDDREIELFLEAEGKKLWSTGKIQPLRQQSRTCALSLPAPSVEKLDPTTIAARAEAATLVLGEYVKVNKKGETAFSVAGGAFVVEATGVCLTSLHVTQDKSSRGFVAMTRDGRVFSVRQMLAYDPVKDLALIQLDLPAGLTLPTLPVALEAAPVGAPVYVMSHPDDRFYLLTAGLVARHTLWRTESGDQAFMSITADFAKGSSGCPVLNDAGAVIGIVNNTESIYYDDDGRKKQVDLQMVVKNATPSWAVKAMLVAAEVVPSPGAIIP